MSMLGKLINHPDFGESAKNTDMGTILHKGETLNYLALTYDDHYEFFLSLYDGERNYLVVGKSGDLDTAKELATIEIEKKMNSAIH